MAIKKGDIIKVEYEGTLDDGTVFDSTKLNGGNPIKFEVGGGQLIKGFEDSIIGKEIGEEFFIKLQPSDAYGDYKTDMVRKMAKSLFPKEQEPQPGMIIQVMDETGHIILASIKHVIEDNVIVDMNHPLAGKVLNFKIKVTETNLEPDPPNTCGCGSVHDHEH